VTNESPSYDKNAQLINAEHVVWYWSSLWETTIPNGPVPFSKGRVRTPSADACQDQAVSSLGPGNYYWGVLGFGPDGHLTHQSVLSTFAIKQETTTGRFCNTVTDCGSVGATSCMSLNHFCVMRCASDLDCFVGTACDFTTIGNSELQSGLCRPSALACPCSSGEQRCDDTGTSALRICYSPEHAALTSSGCDCLGGGGGGSSHDNSNSCYAATFLGIVIIRRWRGRRTAHSGGHETLGGVGDGKHVKCKGN
jgi:hypothetical protein